MKSTMVVIAVGLLVGISKASMEYGPVKIMDFSGIHARSVHGA